MELTSCDGAPGSLGGCKKNVAMMLSQVGDRDGSN